MDYAVHEENRTAKQTNRNRRWFWPRVPTARRRWITSASKKMTSRRPVKGRCYCAPFLSLDPYMRGRMSDEPFYAPPVEPAALWLRWRYWVNALSRQTILITDHYQC